MFGPDLSELRISDEDFQTLICSTYQHHEDEEFKVEYWGRAVEIACMVKGRTTIQARDMERLFSEHRKIQVKLPSLPDIFQVLVSRGVVAPEPPSDWLSDATRGMTMSTAYWIKNWIRPPTVAAFVVMPVVVPLIDKILDRFDTEPFFFEDVVALLDISKHDTNVVMAMLLRKHPQAQAFELTCGTRRLRGIKMGGFPADDEKAFVMQKYAANELQRRENLLTERIIASDKKARNAVREKHPKELVLLELRVKKKLLSELEKLKVLSLQIQQAECSLHESHIIKGVLDALEISTAVAKSSMDIGAAEQIMSAKADMEEMQQELQDLMKCEDSDELALEADALIAETSSSRQNVNAVIPPLLHPEPHTEGPTPMEIAEQL